MLTFARKLKFILTILDNNSRKNMGIFIYVTVYVGFLFKQLGFGKSMLLTKIVL